MDQSSFEDGVFGVDAWRMRVLDSLVDDACWWWGGRMFGGYNNLEICVLLMILVIYVHIKKIVQWLSFLCFRYKTIIIFNLKYITSINLIF